jgi:hypothetical protein
MDSRSAIDQVRKTAELLRKTADDLVAGLPAVEADLAAGVKAAADLAQTARTLKSSRDKLTEAEKSLASIEDSLIKAMDAARAVLHDPASPIETRMSMLALCQKVFAQFAAAGFAITIPAPGEKVDTHRHNVKGSAHSKHDKAQVADVISWGYRFPSGAEHAADILVGDGTQQDQAEAPPKPPPPKPSKSGIAMVIEKDAEQPEKPKKKPAKPVTVFDQLAEAAERNREP